MTTHSPARAHAIRKTRPSRSGRPPSRSANGPRRRARTRGARRCASRSRRAPPPSASPWPPPAPRPAWLRPPFSRAGAARRGGLRGREWAGAEAKWAVAAGARGRGRVGASGGGRERARDFRSGGRAGGRGGEVGSQRRATVQSEQHRAGEEQIPTIAHHQPHRKQRGPPDDVEAGAVPAETLSMWRCG